MRNPIELKTYISNINKFGLNKLIFFVTVQHKRKDVKRDYEILKYACETNHYSDAGYKFCISRQRVHQICKWYSDYASKLSREISIIRSKKQINE